MDVLLIVDVEATCWKSIFTSKKIPEIIELGGTTLMNLNGELEVLGSFSEFVKPKFDTHLSKFCRKLTNIKQEQIDEASEFPIALSNFREKAKKTINGMSCRRMVFGSWSQYDRKQIRKDCKLHGLRYPFGRYWDIEKTFSRHMNEQRLYSVTNALIALGEEYEGDIHRAEDDARNTATIVQKTMSVDWKKHFEKFENEAKRRRKTTNK